MQDSYQQHSHHQYSAHLGCEHILTKSIERWAHRIYTEDRISILSDETRKRRKMADLGSAAGSNSLRTLSVIIDTLHKHTENSAPPPSDIFFEEHPSSNKEKLVETLCQHQQWFRKHDVTYSVLMKSFYEAIFPNESMDFIMSYLCLHWLDTADPSIPLSTWKSLHTKIPTLKNCRTMNLSLSTKRQHRQC